MVRRFPNQVHKQASRLLLAQYIKREPRWFQAVLDYPPLPLPARAPAPRSDYDLPIEQQQAARAVIPKRSRPLDPKPLRIAYLEDELRRQFFEDHPFEAYRAKSIVEDGEIEPEHPVQGAAWTRLRQRGRNPSPEDAIKFALNLHEHHNHSLNQAYEAAVAQFRALRSERIVASHVAVLEAEQYGVEFGPSPVMQAFLKEQKQFESWKMTKEQDMAESIALKRWSMFARKEGGVKRTWSRGEEYVRLWREGVRPTYFPSSSAIDTAAAPAPKPAVKPPTPASEEEAAKKRLKKADYMGIRKFSLR